MLKYRANFGKYIIFQKNLKDFNQVILASRNYSLPDFIMMIFDLRKGTPRVISSKKLHLWQPLRLPFFVIPTGKSLSGTKLQAVTMKVSEHHEWGKLTIMKIIGSLLLAVLFLLILQVPGRADGEVEILKDENRRIRDLSVTAMQVDKYQMGARPILESIQANGVDVKGHMTTKTTAITITFSGLFTLANPKQKINECDVAISDAKGTLLPEKSKVSEKISTVSHSLWGYLLGRSTTEVDFNNLQSKSKVTLIVDFAKGVPETLEVGLFVGIHDTTKDTWSSKAIIHRFYSFAEFSTKYQGLNKVKPTINQVYVDSTEITGNVANEGDTVYSDVTTLPGKVNQKNYSIRVLPGELLGQKKATVIEQNANNERGAATIDIVNPFYIHLTKHVPVQIPEKEFSRLMTQLSGSEESVAKAMTDFFQKLKEESGAELSRQTTKESKLVNEEWYLVSDEEQASIIAKLKKLPTENQITLTVYGMLQNYWYTNPIQLNITLVQPSLSMSGALKFQQTIPSQTTVFEPVTTPSVNLNGANSNTQVSLRFNPEKTWPAGLRLEYKDGPNTQMQDLKTGPARIHGSDTNTNSDSGNDWHITDDWYLKKRYSDDKGLFLQIDPDVKSGAYKGELEWTLVNGPQK